MPWERPRCRSSRRCLRPNDRCVIGAGWGQPSLWRRVLEVVALVGHLLEQRTSGVHESDVRSVRLVRRVQVDVAVGAPTSGGRAVHRTRRRPRCARAAAPDRRRSDRVDGGGDVRHVGDSREAGSTGDQFVEVGGIEQAGLGVDRPFLHNDARIGETSPCPLIGLVILPGDDDLVAVVPHQPHGLGQHIRVLTGRRTEMDRLVGRQAGHHRRRSIASVATTDGPKSQLGDIWRGRRDRRGDRRPGSGSSCRRHSRGAPTAPSRGAQRRGTGPGRNRDRGSSCGRLARTRRIEAVWSVQPPWPVSRRGCRRGCPRGCPEGSTRVP